jgi:1-acyl-sn-glycerol-3-phosphate acyltransferase
MLRILSLKILDLLGWKIIGEFTDIKKAVIIVAPHTSNWDFVLGLMVKKISKLNINYLGKESLFIAPWGYFFRWVGGRPVKRDGNGNQVDQVIKLFSNEDEFRLALSPEGTRSNVDKWRTGFYYIALGANVPLVMVAFDIANKQVLIEKPMKLSGDFNSDFEKISNFYKGIEFISTIY